MHFVKSLSLVVFVTAAAVVSAMPGMDKRTVVNNGIFMRGQSESCGDHAGSCAINDCKPTFHHPDDTTGYCTAGEFKKCPCSKCGNDGELLCFDDACHGEDGKCTTNLYQGCGCAEVIFINS